MTDLNVGSKVAMRLMFGLGFLIAVVAAVYYFVVYTPRQKAYERLINDVNIGQCFNEAYLAYRADWDSNCKTQGMKAGCSLSNNLADDQNARLAQEKKLCLQRYK